MSTPSRSLLLLLLAAGCTPPSEPVDAAPWLRTFEGLHRQVYDVYALPADRDAVWRLLAASFAGEALTDEYVEHWTTKARMVAEETSIDIRKVDYLDVEVLEVQPDRVVVDAAWSVGGVVTHRRHKHPRVNHYEAIYTLAPGSDGWRLVDTRMRDVVRVRDSSREGDIFSLGEGQGGFLDPLDLLDAGVGEDTGQAEGVP